MKYLKLDSPPIKVELNGSLPSLRLKHKLKSFKKKPKILILGFVWVRAKQNRKISQS